MRTYVKQSREANQAVKAKKVRTTIFHVGAIAIMVLVAGGISVVAADRQLADSLQEMYESDLPLTVELSASSNLDDYLTYAALQSPSLKRAFYKWRAAMEKTGYVGALPDPMLSYGRFIETVETRVGPQNQRFSLKQSFPWFGTLGARKDMAEQRAEAAYRKYQSEKLRLFYSVKSAFHEYYYLGRDIGLTQDNLELLTFWESVARAKYKVALKEHPDVIKAQVELGKLEDRLLTLKDKVTPIAARLRAILNLPESVELPIPTTIEIDETSLQADSILSAALANNPDLKAMSNIIEGERAGVRLAKKTTLPKFTISVDYIETGEALNPSLAESGKDPWKIGVGLSLPIWFGKNASKKREAKARLSAAENDYADAQNMLTAFTEKLLFEHSDALRKTSLYRDGLVPKAEQALNASYTAYQAGEADFLNVLDAQRQLLAFQLRLERAISDLAIRRAEIEMIIGNGIEDNQ